MAVEILVIRSASQRLLLTLALLAPFSAAAQDPWGPTPDGQESASAPEDDTPASTAPARIVDHAITLTIDGSKRLKKSQTLTIEILDPAACAAGLHVPAGLDGAMDGSAMVLEDLLIVPADAAKGATYTLKNTTSLPRGEHSGMLSTAPDLPTAKATFTLKSPSWVPMSAWADDRAYVGLSGSGTQSMTVEWTDLAAGEPGQVAFSTWKDWMAAGKALEKRVDGRTASKADLGRELASDLKSTNLGELTRRVFSTIDVPAGSTGTWDTTRSVGEVLKTKSGTPAERGLVLISLLRAAGYTAKPAGFRTAAEPGTHPVTVPAPAVVGNPLVVVEREDEPPLFIDPAADLVAVNELAASLRNAIVWLPGDLPTRLHNTGDVVGQVSVNTSLTIGRSDENTWSAVITASGSASEWLRRRLSPLDEEGRAALLKRLVSHGRPNLARFTATATGIDNPYKPLKITLNGADSSSFSGIGSGLTGTIAPTVGTTLAGWLPQQILVAENMAITPPAGLGILAARVAEPSYHPRGQVSRDYVVQGNRISYLINAQRPYRYSTPAQDASAAEFFQEEADDGIELLLFPPPSGAVAASIRKDFNIEPPRRVALEALMWWKANNDRKARKTLSKALKAGTSVADMTAALAGLTYGNDRRPWLALADLIDEESDLRIAMEGLEANGLEREAWLLAGYLAESEQDALKIPALLTLERLNPSEPPTEDSDAEGFAIYQPQETLLQTAETLATAGNDTAALNQIKLRRAELALDAEEFTVAEALLEELSAQDDAPVLSFVLLAEAKSEAGVSRREVVAKIEEAVARAPYDAVVVGRAARGMSRVEAHHRAMAYGVSAARLAVDNATRWGEAVDYALQAGDLPTALFCAQKASDLDPKNTGLAAKLARIGEFAHDKDAAIAGHERAGTQLADSFPADVDTLMTLAQGGELLAVLQYHDAAVVDSAALLGIRAQQRIDNGLGDDAARDGLLLATRHNKPEGNALAFAATVGRVWDDTTRKAMDAATKEDPTARTARMEFRLISGSGDPRSDARALPGDPRAEAVNEVVTSPATAIAATKGWPEGLSDERLSTPRGFRLNSTLSALKGVTGWSNRTENSAIVVIHGVAGVLPPPLSQLYTVHKQPEHVRPDGGQVVRLDGGILPVYAAIAITGGREVLGLGFTANAAERALDQAINTGWSSM